MVYLGFACAIVGVAAVLAAARGGDAGWAIGVLAVLFVVMVGHDAYSRGLSPLWGLFALCSSACSSTFARSAMAARHSARS